jgi:hypothetical protein
MLNSGGGFGIPLSTPLGFKGNKPVIAELALIFLSVNIGK